MPFPLEIYQVRAVWFIPDDPAKDRPAIGRRPAASPEKLRELNLEPLPGAGCLMLSDGNECLAIWLPDKLYNMIGRALDLACVDPRWIHQYQREENRRRKNEQNHGK